MRHCGRPRPAVLGVLAEPGLGEVGESAWVAPGEAWAKPAGVAPGSTARVPALRSRGRTAPGPPDCWPPSGGPGWWRRRSAWFRGRGGRLTSRRTPRSPAWVPPGPPAGDPTSGPASRARTWWRCLLCSVPGVPRRLTWQAGHASATPGCKVSVNLDEPDGARRPRGAALSTPVNPRVDRSGQCWPEWAKGGLRPSRPPGRRLPAPSGGPRGSGRRRRGWAW